MAEKSNPFPTVEETLKHPAYPTAIWKLVPHKKGRAPVAEGRGGPFNIGWEIHGSGPTKLVVSRSEPVSIDSHDCSGWAQPRTSEDADY